MTATYAQQPVEDPTLISYEYLTVDAPRELEPLYRDTYRSFGWYSSATSGQTVKVKAVTLRLKRDRNIANRALVQELQRTAEEALESITVMERSKNTAAFGASLILGILGAGLLAGSVFNFNAGLMIFSATLGVFGLGFWIAAYYAYRWVRRRRARLVDPLIGEAYELTYETAGQAHRLLT